MDSQRAAGQGEAKARSKTQRAPYGRPQAPIGGRLGLWVVLRLRLPLAGRALRIHALFSEVSEHPPRTCICHARGLPQFHVTAIS